MELIMSIATKTISKPHSWGNIELTELKKPESEGGDIWQHILSYLDAETLVRRIPLVSKDLKMISERDCLWQPHLKGVPQRMLNQGHLSAKKRFVVILKETTLPLRENIKFILANINFKVPFWTTPPVSYTLPWGDQTSTSLTISSLRLFEDSFLVFLNNRRLSLQQKANIIDNYMYDHFFLSLVIRLKHLDNRVELIDTALRLGCNPNRRIVYFPFWDHNVNTYPLHAIAYEALYDQRYIRIVERLLECGANPLAIMFNEGTPRRYIRAHALSSLEHYQRIHISPFISRSERENLIASFNRMNALLLRHENIWNART